MSKFVFAGKVYESKIRLLKYIVSNKIKGSNTIFVEDAPEIFRYLRELEKEKLIKRVKKSQYQLEYSSTVEGTALVFTYCL